MKTQFYYYIILVINILLLSCQLVAGHLTHSLIILTDSYINLYRILDISLGILHLKTQESIQRRIASTKSQQDDSKSQQRLFGRQCTYNFRRLTVLGSFVNGLFLAALLMSVAIEGLQTCLHASHAVGAGEESLLRNNPNIYPAILAGFALVGCLLQWCTAKAHELREQQLGSESLQNINKSQKQQQQQLPQVQPMSQLDAAKVEENLQPPELKPQPNGQTQRGERLCQSQIIPEVRIVGGNSSIFKESKSVESLPTDSHGGSRTEISLRSLKMVEDFEGTNYICLENFGNSEALNGQSGPYSSANRGSAEREEFWWLLVRCSVAPSALIVCAVINFLSDDETVAEIADASSAILVVILLYVASLPPMKRAGRVLMQTVPEQVDIERLRASLASFHVAVLGVKELHVWSLTRRSNRVGTCHLLISRRRIQSEEKLAELINEAKFKFLDHNIKCSAIQPEFVD